jgi:hypothetical protein
MFLGVASCAGRPPATCVLGIWSVSREQRASSGFLHPEAPASGPAGRSRRIALHHAGRKDSVASSRGGGTGKRRRAGPPHPGPAPRLRAAGGCRPSRPRVAAAPRSRAPATAAGLPRGPTRAAAAPLGAAAAASAAQRPVASPASTGCPAAGLPAPSPRRRRPGGRRRRRQPWGLPRVWSMRAWAPPEPPARRLPRPAAMRPAPSRASQEQPPAEQGARNQVAQGRPQYLPAAPRRAPHLQHHRAQPAPFERAARAADQTEPT